MFTWYWHPYIDPNFNLSVVTKAQWGNNSDTGMDDPTYDAMYNQQAVTIKFKPRQKLVWKLEAYIADKRPYIQLVNTNLITAHSNGWTGFQPAAVVVLQVLLHLAAPDVVAGEVSRTAGG